MAYLVVSRLLLLQMYAAAPMSDHIHRKKNLSLAVQDFTLIFAHDIMMNHAKTFKWYFVMLRIHILAWLWQECITRSLASQTILLGVLWPVGYGKSVLWLVMGRYKSSGH